MRHNKFLILMIFFSYFSAVFVQAAPALAKEKVETRKNKKGRIDRWIWRDQGVVTKTEHDRNGDGKPDLRILEDHGRFVSKEYDDNFDGKMDRIEKALPRGSSGRAPKAYATQ